MNKATLFTVIFLCTIPASRTLAQATKNIHEREQLWFGYFNQSRISDKFGLWMDVHYRTTDNFADRRFQFLIRSAVTYFITDELRVHAGYVLAQHFPAKGLKESRTEHRPWQQISWHRKYTGFTTRQWIRTEQRFNERISNDVRQSGYDYNFRVRYSFSWMIALGGKELVANTPFIAVNNEVFFNFGDRIVYNTFDQNRIFAGIGYQWSAHLNAQIGYMNIFQQEASGNNYWSTHAIRLFVFHSLDLRKKDESQ